jgi:hypothetical protein
VSMRMYHFLLGKVSSNYYLAYTGNSFWLWIMIDFTKELMKKPSCLCHLDFHFRHLDARNPLVFGVDPRITHEVGSAQICIWKPGTSRVVCTFLPRLPAQAPKFVARRSVVLLETRPWPTLRVFE